MSIFVLPPQVAFVHTTSTAGSIRRHYCLGPSFPSFNSLPTSLSVSSTAASLVLTRDLVGGEECVEARGRSQTLLSVVSFNNAWMRITPSSRIFFIIADARQRVRLFATHFRVFPIRRRISYNISSNTPPFFCPPTTNPPPLHFFFALHHNTSTTRRAITYRAYAAASLHFISSKQNTTRTYPSGAIPPPPHFYISYLSLQRHIVYISRPQIMAPTPNGDGGRPLLELVIFRKSKNPSMSCTLR